MSSEQVVTDGTTEAPDVAEAPEASPQPKRGRGLSNRWFLLIGGVILVNLAALILVPPFPKDGAPGEACEYPACFINGTLEFPARAHGHRAGRLPPTRS